MPATLDFADRKLTGKMIRLDEIDFMRLANIAHQAILRMRPMPGATKEQAAALAITQLFTEHLESLAE